MNTSKIMLLIQNCRSMDRQWMYDDRCTMALINGLKSFLDAAEAHKSLKGYMCCPCRLCQNKMEYSKRSTLYAHIYEKGFMDNYTLWTKHGEPGVVMQDGEGDDDDDEPKRHIVLPEKKKNY